MISNKKISQFYSIAAIVLLTVAISISLSGTKAMALLSTNILFSQVEGQVVRNGKPVEGAEVTQITLWSSKGEVKPVTTRTDENGYFSFSEISRNASFSNLLPGQIAIVQKINIRLEGAEYRGWINTKSNYEQNGENNGKPLKFVCNLNHEPTNQGDDFGVCKVV